MKRRIVVILLQYDTQKYPNSFAHLKSYIERQVDKSRYTFILVNNNDEGDGVKYFDVNTIYMRGDNTSWEFSAWQKAIQFIRCEDIEYDVILFVNDSFEVNGPSYVARRNINWLAFKASLLGAAIGLVSTQWKKFNVKGYQFRTWLRTDCFFMPRGIMDELGTLVSIDEDSLDQFLPTEFPGIEDVFLKDAPIDDRYREHMVKWLTEEWHSSFDLDKTTWPFFRAKVKAILNESLLSARIRQARRLILPYDILEFAVLKSFAALRNLLSQRHRYRHRTIPSGLKLGA